MLGRVGVIALMALAGCAGFSACDDGAETAGEFALTFNWPGGVKPAIELFATARLQRVGGGEGEGSGNVTLSEAGPTLVSLTATTVLDFGELTYGDGRVIVVEMRDGEAATARLVYAGRSKPFSFRAGERVEVEVDLELAPLPGTNADGTIAEETFWVERGGARVAATATSEVELALRLDEATATTVRFANDVAFTQGVKSFRVAEMRKGEDGAYRLPEGELWDLNGGVNETQVVEGARTVFAVMTNALGLPGPTLRAVVTLDTLAPELRVGLNGAVFNRGAEVRLVVNPNESLPVSPEVTVSGPIENEKQRTLTLTEGEPLGLSWVFARPVVEFAAADAAAVNGTYTVSVRGADAVGNASERVDAARFTLDVTTPEITLVSLASDNAVDTSQATRGDVVTAVLAVSEPPDGEPVVTFGLRPMELAEEVEAEEGGRRFTFTTAIEGDEVEGARPVLVSLSDAAGNGAVKNLGTITVDRTAPEITASALTRVPFYAPSTSDGGRTVRLTRNDPVTGADVTAELLAYANEPIRDDATLTSPEAGGLSLAATSIVGQRVLFTWGLTEGGVTLADGSYTMTVTVTDFAGNTKATTLDLSLIVDTTAPHAAATGAPDTIVYVRAPWGSAATGGQSRQAVRAIAGSFEPSATVLVAREGGEALAQATAGADGSVEVALPLDVTALDVRQIDRAGNLSERAPVIDVVTTLTGGNVRTSPMQVFTSPTFAPSFVDARRTLVKDLSGLATADDGLSLTTRAAGAWSQPATMSESPSVREGYGMAFDPIRGRTVLFSGAVLTNDTWEFDGERWDEARVVGDAPPRRDASRMVFDEKHGVSLLFGGYSDSPLNELWQFDGERWELVEVSGESPPERFYAPFAYDPVRGVSLIVGGNSFGGNLNDTWEYNHATRTFTQRVTATQRTEDLYALGVDYDRARDVFVFYGQLYDFKTDRVTYEVWEYDRTDWRDVSPDPALPGPKFGSGALVYHGALQRIVYFGGYDGVPRNDVWAWDGDAWEKIEVEGEVPQGRYFTGFAYDSQREEAVTFSGRFGEADSLADTWAFDGARWHNRTPQRREPGRRISSTLAYDTAQSKAVLFSGVIQGQPDSETWEFDGLNWTKVETATLPQGRLNAATTYDAERGEVVMFGGQTGQFLNQTWVYREGDWHARATSGTRPEGRYQHALAYDPLRKKVVLFGGVSRVDPTPGDELGDTWEWDGTEWRLAATGGPPGRFDTAMAFDPRLGKIVMGGGTRIVEGTPFPRRVDQDDLWAWDGTTWEQLESGGMPATSQHLFAFDDRSGRMLLIPVRTSDVWAWDGATWEKVETTASTAPPPYSDVLGVYDTARGAVFTYAGLSDFRESEAFYFRMGQETRPSHLVRVPFSAWGAASRDEIASVRVTWLATRSGGEASGARADEVAMYRWEEASWQEVTSSEARDGFAQLSAVSADAEDARGYFNTAGDTLSVIIAPATDNGAPSSEPFYGSLSSDAIEVQVKHRRVVAP